MKKFQVNNAMHMEPKVSSNFSKKTTLFHRNPQVLATEILEIFNN